ncbi:unnamed protein product [Rhizophagus irregularis]|nr:unnamed protein product [Rhizophagus irregularis]
MAIEILKHNAEHTFQHDLESFFYVLCWICCEYEGSRDKLRASDCGRKNLMKWLSVITNLYHVKGTIYIYIPLYLTSNTTIITSNIERG